MRVLLEDHIDPHSNVLGDRHARTVMQLLKSRDLRFGQINRRRDLFTCHIPRVPGINTEHQAPQVVFLKFRLKYKEMLKLTSPLVTLTLLGILSGCASRESAKPSDGKLKAVSSEEAGIELIAPDARSQSPRQRRVYQESGGKKVLSRVESDFNGDGRVDFIESYDPSGNWVQIEKSDLDGDGRFDVTYISAWNATRKETRISEQQFDTNYDGSLDLWKEFDARGRLTLRRLDRDFDGRADYWEYYDNGQVVRIEQDLNGDGSPDSIPTPRTRAR